MKAVVTGGCSGLGACFTNELMKRGYEVFPLYNTSSDAAKKMASEHVFPKHCDITNEEEIIETFADIEDIDILINNAGYACDNFYLDKTKKEFMHVLEVNVVGTFLVTKYAFNKINNGVVINISSNNAIDNYNPISMDYDASKAGVNMLTKDFAQIKSNVKVISICPGWIETDAVKEMNPSYLEQEMAKVNQTKLIEPQELVNYVLDHLDSYQNGDIIEIKEV